MCFVSTSWVSLQSECAVAETGKLPELETRTSIFRSSTLLSKDSLGEPFDT